MKTAEQAEWSLKPWHWCLLLAVVFAVRAGGIHAQSLSVDEWFEIDLAHHSVRRIVTEGDGFPPLYNLLLKCSIGLLGDASARWLSVLLSLLTLPVVIGIGRMLGGPRAGLMTGVFLALMPINIWHAQEARAYALLLFAAAVSLWFAVRLITGDESRRSWWGLAASLTLGLYVHYFFAFLAVYLVSILWVILGRRSWRPLVVTGLAVTIVCLPWLFCLQGDLATQQAWPDKSSFGLASLGFTYFSLFSGYTLGPSLRDLHVMPVSAALRDVFPWLAAAGCGTLLVLFAAARPIQRARLPLALMTAPILVGLVCNVFDVGYHGRYVTWCQIPMALCLGLWLTQTIRPRVAWSGAVILLALFGAAVFNRQTVDRYQNADAQNAAQWLSQSAPRPVIVVSGYMAPLVRYYLAEDWCDEDDAGLTRYESRPWTVWRLSNRTPPDERRQNFQRLLSKFGPGDQVWLVYARSFHEDRQGDLLRMFEQQLRGHPVQEFPGLRLYAGRGSVATTAGERP